MYLITLTVVQAMRLDDRHETTIKIALAIRRRSCTPFTPQPNLQVTVPFFGALTSIETRALHYIILASITSKSAELIH